MIKKIITHAGKAHRDDLYSCAVALNFYPKIETIERRNPTIEELESSNVLILDVGEKHEPEKNNFDHHLKKFHDQKVCALTLLLEHHNLLNCFKRFNWVELSASIDNCGPFQTAKDMNLNVETLMMLQSPLEDFILFQFSSQEVIFRDYEAYEMLKNFGKHLLEKGKKLDERIDQLKNGGAKIIEIYGLKGLTITPTPNPSFGVGFYIKENIKEDIVFSISNDDRGEGLTLYRFNDNPKIDYRLIKEEKGVTFVHHNGFIAKTKSKDWEEAKVLVGKSIV